MKKFRILALLLSLIMVLTACGGDSKTRRKPKVTVHMKEGLRDIMQT